MPDLTQDLMGKLFGDRGYSSQALFEQLYARGLQLITKSRKNMKNRLTRMVDKVLLRKRALIKLVNDQLKNVCQIGYSRLQLRWGVALRSLFNFLVNLLAGLVAYTYQPKKPALDLE